MTHQIRCPCCGLRPTTTYTKWGERHDCCGLWSWEGKPLVDAETHAARRAAHEAFDPLWQEGSMTRSVAYLALRRVMRLNEKQCHMARMTKEHALAVPAAVEKIRARMREPNSAAA